MIKNYFKTALRSLWKNKTYSFLNIFGLAVGIACAGFIFLWIENEKSYDKFNANYDQLYRVKEHQSYDGKNYTFDATPGLLGPVMKDELPGVKATCRANWDQKLLFSLNNKAIYEDGFYADSSLFNLFSFTMLEGNANQAFPQLHSVVISEKMSEKFFGKNSKAVGRSLKVDNKEEYIISAVFKDLPENSTLKCEWVLPFRVYYDQNDWLQSWGNNGILTYVRMDPKADIKAFNEKFLGYIRSKDSSAVARPFLQAMNDWRLRDRFEDGKAAGGRIQYVRMFSIIAWIILLIACINFMNLATARSEKRAREVGVRKVLGAGRKILIGQFLGEAIFMSFIAVFLAVLLMLLAMPGFNLLVEKQLTLGLDQLSHIVLLLSIGVICGMIAGSYPALYLSSFNPIWVFKGMKMKGSSAAYVRKGLVVLQFTISIILIIGTIIIYQQVQHIKNRELGYNKDNLVQLTMEGDLRKNFSVTKQELLQTGLVENAAMGGLDLLNMGSQTTDFGWEGKDVSKKVLITIDNINPDYLKTTGIQLKAGRDFNAVPKNDSASIIINETLAKMMGKENAVGQIVTRDTVQYTVIGVAKDFTFGDMYGKSDPLVFLVYPESYNFLYVKLRSGVDVEKGIAGMESVIKKNNPAYPVVYDFIDTKFNNIFKSEMLIGKLSRVFSLLAIIISCLGLFGLAAFMAEKRTKEIGIRKVLGATVPGITGLLSKDFLQLVGISAVIAFPISWWAMHNWLQDFAYRITISWWVFVVAGLLALLIALLTVSFQAIKAALSNPVTSLRTE